MDIRIDPKHVARHRQTQLSGKTLQSPPMPAKSRFNLTAQPVAQFSKPRAPGVLPSLAKR